MRQWIHEQQAPKFEKSIEEQEKKDERNVQRNIINGIEASYENHLSLTKQECKKRGRERPQLAKNRYRQESAIKFLRLLRTVEEQDSLV